MPKTPFLHTIPLHTIFYPSQCPREKIITAFHSFHPLWCHSVFSIYLFCSINAVPLSLHSLISPFYPSQSLISSPLPAGSLLWLWPSPTVLSTFLSLCNIRRQLACIWNLSPQLLFSSMTHSASLTSIPQLQSRNNNIYPSMLLQGLT